MERIGRDRARQTPPKVRAKSVRQLGCLTFHRAREHGGPVDVGAKLLQAQAEVVEPVYIQDRYLLNQSVRRKSQVGPVSEQISPFSELACTASEQSVHSAKTDQSIQATDQSIQRTDHSLQKTSMSRSALSFWTEIERLM